MRIVRTRIKRVVVTAIAIVTLAAAAGALGQEAAPVTESLMEEVQRLYEQAKAAGEKVPGSISEWVKEDLSRIGAWEYRIETLDTAKVDQLQARLNELGNERWDVFWVSPEKKGTQARFYFKRPSRSYLRAIPVGDILKLVPTGGE